MYLLTALAEPDEKSFGSRSWGIDQVQQEPNIFTSGQPNLVNKYFII